jgi:hypothetical protein
MGRPAFLGYYAGVIAALIAMRSLSQQFELAMERFEAVDFIAPNGWPYVDCEAYHCALCASR